MKPTSVIFLILAAILIVGGVVLCLVSGALASGADIELFCDYVDENGNAVTEHDISGKSISSVKIDLDSAIINIRGGSEKSYVKVENFPDKAYEFWLTAGELNIKDIHALSIFSSFRINESGFGFDGLRHYLALNKYEDKDNVINIYLSANDIITDLDIDVNKGEINIYDLGVLTELDLNVNDGKINLVSVESAGKATVTGNNAVLTFDGCDIADTVANVKENGTINCDIILQHVFTLDCVSSGNVYLDSVKANAQYSGVYPAEPIILPVTEDTAEGEETTEPSDAEEEILPVSFKGDVNHGDIKISVKSFE